MFSKLSASFLFSPFSEEAKIRAEEERLEQLRLQKEKENAKLLAAEEEKFFDSINTDDGESKLALKVKKNPPAYDPNQVVSWISMLDAVRCLESLFSIHICRSRFKEPPLRTRGV